MSYRKPTWLFLCGSACLAATLAQPPSAGCATDGKPYVTRPAKGNVVGYVLDAATHEPVVGAAVVIRQGGEWAARGPTVAETDERGRYQAQSPLGRQKSSFKFSLFRPSEKREEKAIDIKQLDVRVEKPGYKTFLGPVTVAVASVPRFTIYMHEIRLAPEAAELTSFSPDNGPWESLAEFAVEPGVARPGDKVTVSAVLRLPRERGIRYEIWASGPAGLLGAPPFQIRAASAPDETWQMRYERALRVGKKPKARAGVFEPRLVRLLGGTRDEWEPAEAEGVLVQVVTDVDEAEAAALCQQAFELRAEDDLADAASKAEQATERCPSYRYAWELHGDILMDLNRPGEAAASYRHMEELEEDVEEGLPKLATALAASGKAQEGLDLLRASDKDPQGIKAAVRTRMSASFNVAMARCYVALGQIEMADARLKRATEVDRDLLLRVALERAQAEVGTASRSVDAHLALGRALADLGRWQEAAVWLGRAVDLDPNSAWARLDLAEVLGAGLARHEDALVEAQTAVRLDAQNGEAVLTLARAYQRLGRHEEALALYGRYAQLRPEDFYGQHWRAIGLLLEGKAPEAAAAFQAALELAREKGQTSAKVGWAPLVGSHYRMKTFVWGYRYEEADWDYVILDSLETLRTTPGDAVASFNIDRALVHLGLGGAVLPRLEGRLAERDDPEVHYLIARAHSSLAQVAEARAALERVIERNPPHPYARVDLARLLLSEGDLLGAQRQIALHRQNYPEEAQQGLLAP